VEAILLGDDGQNYWMQAWVVMPNHVYPVVDVWDVPLAKLTNDWTSRSSRQANKLLVRRGAFRQEDYYDTLISDEAHLKPALRYTEQNPVKAHLTKVARLWPWSSARHRDEYGRLSWQRGPEARGVRAASMSEARRPLNESRSVGTRTTKRRKAPRHERSIHQGSILSTRSFELSAI